MEINIITKQQQQVITRQGYKMNEYKKKVQVLVHSQNGEREREKLP